MGERGEIRKILAYTETVGLTEAIDQAVKKIDEVEQRLGPGGRADIFDSQTGEHVVRIEPESSVTSTGYGRVYSDAWDRMMERRREREAKGQRGTDD
ncbi:hypothetical protein A2Z22_03885 [Candidatus Woesebacteria bacterium RBG_16_34_12]|uniref:Uncharacterized protein n=1 Tax=Candidatus Woesebacteria bacterium RBG_16_34_12 TaxID=1802480 RepID=A0A1F7X7L8_9BACT|nr:MAG: hypothetical protein A2Z22_03885 [Candidatus Woesebacteria bacterium RBG_16_34_12]